MTDDTRTCKVCGETKPLTDEFYKGRDTNYKGKITRYFPHECRACHTIWQREQYNVNPKTRARQLMLSTEQYVQKRFPAAWHGTIAPAAALKLLAATHCSYCGVPASDIWGFSLDHHVPLALGGAHSLDNLYPCCEPCNRAKHDMAPQDFKRWMDGLVGRLAWLRAQ